MKPFTPQQYKADLAAAFWQWKIPGGVTWQIPSTWTAGLALPILLPSISWFGDRHR